MSAEGFEISHAYDISGNPGCMGERCTSPLNSVFSAAGDHRQPEMAAPTASNLGKSHAAAFSRARHGRCVQVCTITARQSHTTFLRDHSIAHLRHMFEEGLDVDAVDEHGNTLLMVAAQNNQLKAAKLCWRQGVDPNAANVGIAWLVLRSPFRYAALPRRRMEELR